jgi:transcription antitermination factor NusG
MFESECRNPWLVLRTKNRHESVVESVLQQKQVPTYLPKRAVVRSWQGHKRKIEVPLFPGYVFVRPSASQYEGMRYIRGSCGFVLASGRPAALPERDLDAVKMLVDSGADLTVDPELVAGTRVKIASGALTGLHGELVRIKNQQVLVVNVDLVGSSVRVELDRGVVEAL